jgi:hypothetical protein
MTRASWPARFKQIRSTVSRAGVGYAPAYWIYPNSVVVSRPKARARLRSGIVVYRVASGEHRSYEVQLFPSST